MESGLNSLTAGPDGKKRVVSYFYDPAVGNYYYGQGHPMKPHRIRMAHSLIVHYDLHHKLDMFRPYPAHQEDLCVYHSSDYISFLSSLCSSETQHQQHEHGSDTQHQQQYRQQRLRILRRFNVAEDCPVFNGLYEFCQSYAGGSIGAAVKLNQRKSDIAINWSGGLHHAKKCEASGFCYVNDIVLAILELLKCHEVRRLLLLLELVTISLKVTSTA